MALDIRIFKVLREEQRAGVETAQRPQQRLRRCGMVFYRISHWGWGREWWWVVCLLVSSVTPRKAQDVWALLSSIVEILGTVGVEVVWTPLTALRIDSSICLVVWGLFEAVKVRNWGTLVGQSLHDSYCHHTFINMWRQTVFVLLVSTQPLPDLGLPIPSHFSLLWRLMPSAKPTLVFGFQPPRGPGLWPLCWLIVPWASHPLDLGRVCHQ